MDAPVQVFTVKLRQVRSQSIKQLDGIIDSHGAPASGNDYSL